MQVFRLLNEVLEELYPSIPGQTENEKDEFILESLNKLSDGYSKLAVGATIDYSAIEARFAYLFRYVTCHSYLVKRSLDNAKLSNLLDNSDIMNICVFGGGPSTEILGILNFLNNKRITINCKILDKENAWQDVRNIILSKLEHQYELNYNSIVVDFKNEVTINSNEFMDSDIFFFVYLFSEINEYKHIQAFLMDVMNNSKKGAKFIFIDNNIEDFYSPFTIIANKITTNIFTEKGHIPLDTTEQKVDLGRFCSKFECPKLDSESAIFIYERT